MATIDDKVVAMSFESSKFEAGVNVALTAIDKLKAALHFPTAGKGLDDMNAAAKRVDLSHIASGVDSIKNKLGALSVAALAIFAQIAAKAVTAGANLVKAFTLDPLKAGFAEYSTNLNAIQTILANTEASGATLKDVNAALLDLNKYSDKTIYNFSQMAKNIGTFTAAGVDLKTSTASIKGIANLAALSGSNAEQASTAMYQLSQAISSGAVKLQDWNSVVNAGMGGTVFQRALAQTAEAMGTIKKGAVELKGPMKNVSISGKSFRQSLSTPGKDSWLTSKVLTTTLQQFTGDLTDAQLAAEGFNAQQIKAIQQTAKTAQHAATEVKTISQVFDVAKETAGSGWAQTFQIIFGDFEEAKSTFTALSNTINGFINKNAEARNKVLADWKELGGRTVLISGISTAFKNLGQILAPIKKAFRDIFPATTGKDLFNLTMRFEEFSRALKPSAETVDNLRRTFRGVFAVLDIGWQIVKGVFTTFSSLFGAVHAGQGGFLSLTATIGDFLVQLDESLKKGKGLHNFFAGLGTAIAVPIKFIQNLARALGDLFGKFDGFSTEGFDNKLDGVGDHVIPFKKIIDALIQGIEDLGSALGDAAANMNFEAILQVIRTGLFAGLIVMFKQFLGHGSFLQQLSGRGGFFGGMFSGISQGLGSVQGTMKSFQNTLRAKTLKDIAIAIGILALSLVALSLIDPERLNAALGAMTVLFGELIAAMALLDKAVKSPGFLKLPFIAAGLIALSIAIGLLTLSVLAMSRLSWDELSKGLAGIGGLLVGITTSAKFLSASSGGLIRAGIGIIAIAVALKILASAMADFAEMSWTEIAKGLTAVGGGLAIIAGVAQIAPKGMILMGVGLIAIAAGLKILADAVMKFSTMNWHEMGKGLAGIAGSLLIIAGAMHLMPGNLPLTAAGLVLVSFALGKIADAVIKMGGMSIREIAKGLGTLGGALALLAAGLYAMSGTIGGAIALGIAATGIALITPALILLGRQSWTSIIKSMVTLAAALAILGIAGVALGPVVPALLGLGAALLLIGGGLALAGAGVFLIGAGLSAIAVSGPLAIGILLKALTDLTESFGEMGKNLVLGLLEIVKAFAATAPQFVEAVVKIIDSLLDAIIKSTPKIAEAFTTLLIAALKILADNQDRVIQAGFDLILALIQGIKNNLPQLVTQTIEVIALFLRTVASRISTIVTAGVSVIIALMKGIADNLARVVTTAISIVTKFISAILGGLGAVPAAGLKILTQLLSGIATNLGQAIKAGTDIIVKIVTGIGDAGVRIVKAGREAASKFIHALATEIPKLAQDVFDAIIDLVNGMANVIGSDANTAKMRDAAKHLGYAIINGLTFGALAKAQEFYDSLEGIARKGLSKLAGIFKPGSPSKVTTELGIQVIEGLIKGMEQQAPKAYTAAETMSTGVIESFKKMFEITSPSKVMIEIGQFVGQGFAQGIRGSQDDIKGAFADLNKELTDAMVTSRETIASEQDKLDKLRASKKPDAAAIKEAQKTIAENQALLERSSATHRILVVTLKDEKAELIGLAGEFQNVSTKLQAAKDKLAELKKERADTVASLTDKFSTLPDLVMTDAEGNPVDAVGMFSEALKHQVDAVAAYNATLEQLRKLGLNKDIYEKLLNDGTADQQFASQLLSGGKTAVQGLNKLDDQLAATSKRLATNAADNLKNAGIDAAKGLVKGLQSQHDEIRKEMEVIAREMLAALRKELKSKSPSQAFAEIGMDSMEGLAQGFSKGTKMVTSAVGQAGKDALTAMKSTMSKVSDIVTSELNPSPVITPILDLTQVRTQASELAGLTSVVPITAAASYGQAALISAAQIAAQQAEENSVVPGGTSVNFEQNNYSPESLTEIEIYRQTRNQLSQLKSVLAIT